MSATAQELLTLKIAAEDCIKAAGYWFMAEGMVKSALMLGDGKKACLELAKAEDAMREVFDRYNAAWTVETKAAIDAANAAHDRIVEIRGATFATATEAAGYLPGQILYPIRSGEIHGRNVDEILAEIRESRSGIDYDNLLTLVGTEYGEAMRMLEPTTPATPPNLSQSQQDIMRVVEEVGHRLSGEEIAAELEQRDISQAESTRKSNLSTLGKLGLLPNQRHKNPPGYGLPHWD